MNANVTFAQLIVISTPQRWKAGDLVYPNAYFYGGICDNGAINCELGAIISKFRAINLTECYDQRVIVNIFIPNLITYITGGTPSNNLVNYAKGY